MIAVAVAPYLGISHGILDTSSRVSREFKPRFRASTFWSCTQTLIETLGVSAIGISPSPIRRMRFTTLCQEVDVLIHHLHFLDVNLVISDVWNVLKLFLCLH